MAGTVSLGLRQDAFVRRRLLSDCLKEWSVPTSSLLAAARGDKPADLLLRNARIVNLFSGEIEEADIALCDGLIAGNRRRLLQLPR